MDGMTGLYQHNLDSKGRLFIPAKLREDLGEVFYVTLSSDTCLWAYPNETWQELRNKVNEMPFSKQKNMRALFAYAAKCEPDSQGRILLPQKLREIAKLEKSVTVVGNNNHAEFWDTDIWNREIENEISPDNIGRIMEELEL